MSLLLELFPDAYVLCCVRDPVAVVDSIERLLQKHPTRLSTIIGLEAGATVYRRVDMLMNPVTGVVGYSLNATKEAYYGMHGDRLLMVKYDDLARDPGIVFARIHEKLELEPFSYDFDAIEDIPGSAVFDEALGTPGLHSLKKRVVFEPRTSILPPDIFNNLPAAFWS
jgi:sulfotransferase